MFIFAQKVKFHQIWILWFSRFLCNLCFFLLSSPCINTRSRASILTLSILNCKCNRRLFCFYYNVTINTFENWVVLETSIVSKVSKIISILYFGFIIYLDYIVLLHCCFGGWCFSQSCSIVEQFVNIYSLIFDWSN